jgi:hypothetical protein
MNKVYEVQVDGHTVSAHTSEDQAVADAEAYARTWGREGLDIKTTE